MGFFGIAAKRKYKRADKHIDCLSAFTTQGLQPAPDNILAVGYWTGLQVQKKFVCCRFVFFNISKKTMPLRPMKFWALDLLRKKKKRDEKV